MSYNAQDEVRGPYEEVEKVVGRLVYLKGHPFPMKGIPTVEDVNRANKAKIMLKDPKILLGLLTGRMGQIRALHATIRPFPYYELCPAAQGTFDISFRFYDYLYGREKALLIAEIASYIIETDMAYRFRLQHLASETTTVALTCSPIKEIKRLLEVNGKNDYETVHRKFQWAVSLIIPILLVPRVRKAFRYAIAVGISPLQLDHADRYWCGKRNDYGHEIWPQ